MWCISEACFWLSMNSLYCWGLHVEVKPESPDPRHVGELDGVRHGSSRGVHHQHPGVLPVSHQQRPVTRQVHDAPRVDGAALHHTLQAPGRALPAGPRAPAPRGRDPWHGAVTVRDQAVRRRDVTRAAREDQLRGEGGSTRLTLQRDPVHYPTTPTIHLFSPKKSPVLQFFKSLDMILKFDIKKRYLFFLHMRSSCIYS